MSLAFGLGSPGVLKASDAYQLTPGDEISLRVIAWNSLTLQFDEFAALDGVFSIDEEGVATLPLLGGVQLSGMSVADASERVSLSYQQQLGLANPPSAILNLTGYQPIFILGDVAHPGRYEFEPGLTATRALALAGGIYRAGDLEGNNALSAIRTQGALGEVGIDLLRLQMKAARLKAEMDGDEEFPRPDLAAAARSASELDALYDHERSLFESRRQQLQRSLASLDGSSALLETEITAVVEKHAGLSRQVDMVRESVGNTESLLERGLARSPALVSLQQTLMDLEARQLDSETAIFRARQQLSEIERERLGVVSGRQLQVLNEIQETEAAIEKLKNRRDMNRQILVGIEADMQDEAQQVTIVTRFRVQRGEGDDQETSDVTGNYRLRPLDVVEVEQVMTPL